MINVARLTMARQVIHWRKYFGANPKMYGWAGNNWSSYELHHQNKMNSARIFQPERVMLLTVVVFCLAMSSCNGTVGSDSESRDQTRNLNRLWESPLVVEATGCRSGWKFRYPGPDGALWTDDDFLAEQIIRVPVDAKIEVHLKSTDFIYVWSCPSLGMKEIAVPDLSYKVCFRAPDSGFHDLVMDPMCGFPASNDKLMGRIVVQSPVDFGNWVRERTR